MFPDISKVSFLSLTAVTLCALALQHPAAAQTPWENPTECGFYKDETQRVVKNITEDEGRIISGQYSTPCATYYAPYAIMAAAVYAPVFTELEQNRRARRKVPDAEIAVKALRAEADVTAYAKTLLRGWSYLFGSEGYTACLHDKDEAYQVDDACKRALPGRIRGFFGSNTDFAFNVWARRRRTACAEVSIVFRGTASWRDYISSGYRYTGWAADTGYHQLERNIDAIIGRIRELNCHRTQTQIVSVGHSLGAGLAELAAFAPRIGGPRIAKVFAFNPTSESGYKLVKRDRLNSNAGSKNESLEIDYVYHPGEILEQERVWVPQYPIQERCFPLVRIVRFDVSKERGLGPQHGIDNFASGIVRTSMNSGRLSAPPTVSDCGTRYHRPGGEEAPVAAAPGQAIYARGRPFARTAGTNWYGLTSAYATQARMKRQRVQALVRPAALQREFDSTGMIVASSQ